MTGNTRDSIQTIAVIGQGYVGLPLSLLFISKGFTVYGVDKDLGKIGALCRAKSYLPDVTDEELEQSLKTGRFHPTDQTDCITGVDAIIVCVPTPLNAEHSPDLTILERAVADISRYLQKGQLVILESSTYPGTTREVVKPLLEQGSGLNAGTDFHIGYSPERIDPGNEDFKVEQISKVISGLTPACLERAGDLYGRVFDSVVNVSSPEVAEFTKLLENAHRLINISFINELATICDEMNIDIWEVIEAAKTKPFGFTPYYPGPGIGGHCIPVDPLYLQWKAQKLGKTSKFIEIADEVNRNAPHYIAGRVEALLAKHQAPKQANLLIYGVAYKRDINDVRESPALDLISLLIQSGHQVSYHDPYIDEIEVGGEIYKSVDLNEEILRNSHCVIIVTDHTVIPIDKIAAYAPVVFDTRNVTDKLENTSHIYRLGTGTGMIAQEAAFINTQK
ncbi:nucleotide sugar dehydrogenase [Paenibacillus sp. DYY-L-2]|uniref:nucleotide sugar dehydrogenase n=1 Tax=Paenibacillus sp. DYY-L-2 TaxID=3447013 RepID=UPI003F4F5158